MIDAGIKPGDLMDKRLWDPVTPTGKDFSDIEQLFVYFAADPRTWSFWRDWYQGFLDGEPLDWELQRRVAIIPENDWDEGPAHVAGIIEEIRARFEVERDAKAVIALLA